jgi:tripartite ATP-independent transporter DctM subunit
MTAAAVFGLLIGLILLGVPIAVSLGLAAIVVMAWMGGTDLLIILAQRMYSGISSFPLLAIPFFILAGNLMNTGGMTRRIFAFAQLFVGRIRGGLAHVNVVGSMIFAGMSGSAVADAAGLGVIEIEAMRKEGYPAKYAACITAVSSTIGPIVPPSIPFVLYGSLASVSVGTLFLAGVVPGLLMGIALMAAIAVEAHRRELPRMRKPVYDRATLLATLGAVPALATPALIIGGILSGVVTPTEAAVIAALYALLLGLFAYRELRPEEVWQIVWESARQTVQVMFIIAAASAYGWVLVQQQIPNAVIDGMLSFSTTPWVILLLINIVLLVLGLFIEPIAIMLIATPILLPLAAKIGVSPEHLGVIVVLNLMIGLVTPPVGLCLYAVASVSREPMGEIVKELWPYLIALFAVLALVTYVPAVALWLPRQLGF